MKIVSTLVLLWGILAASANAAGLTFLSGPFGPVDTVNWSGVGPDGTTFSDGLTENSVLGNAATVNLGTQPALGGLTSVVCAASNPVNCSWGNQSSGYATGDTLLWLEGLDSNFNPVGTGPETISLSNSVFGLGEFIQTTSAGAFTASLAIYNGALLLGTHSYSSNGAGDPLFVGAVDTTADITKAVVTVTGCGSFQCDPNDFSSDTLLIFGAPEPSTFALAGALFVLVFSARKRLNLNRGNN